MVDRMTVKSTNERVDSVIEAHITLMHETHDIVSKLDMVAELIHTLAACMYVLAVVMMFHVLWLVGSADRIGLLMTGIEACCVVCMACLFAGFEANRGPMHLGEED